MFNINYLAVVVAAIGSMVLGSIWYGPLFGKVWMKLSGMGNMTPEQMAEGKKNMTKNYAWQFVSSAVMAYVMSLVVSAFGAGDFFSGVQVGFWIWLGFAAAASLGMMFWEGKPKKLWMVNNGYNLLNLCWMGALLAIWS